MSLTRPPPRFVAEYIAQENVKIAAANAGLAEHVLSVTNVASLE